MKLRSPASLESLGKIGHNRNSSTADLISKSEVFCKRSCRGGLVDRSSQITCFLPRDKVLKLVCALSFHLDPQSSLLSPILSLLIVGSYSAWITLPSGSEK